MKKIKLFIMGVAALLVLGSSGAGGEFSLIGKAYAGGGGGGEAGGVEFVEMTPLILPIVDNTGVTQTVNLVVALEVANAEAVETVKKYKPRLTDAYIQGMYGVLNKHAALKGGVIQVGYLKDKLNSISHKVLGDDVVQNVLIQVVQQQPI